MNDTNKKPELADKIKETADLIKNIKIIGGFIILIVIGIGTALAFSWDRLKTELVPVYGMGEIENLHFKGNAETDPITNQAKLSDEAKEDGFISVKFSNGATKTVSTIYGTVYKNNKTFKLAEADTTNSSTNSDNRTVSLFFPVKKGETWEVKMHPNKPLDTGETYECDVFWRPFKRLNSSASENASKEQ